MFQRKKCVNYNSMLQAECTMKTAMCQLCCRTAQPHRALRTALVMCNSHTMYVMQVLLEIQDLLTRFNAEVSLTYNIFGRVEESSAV